MIATEWRGRALLVTIDRHERRNALDLEHCRALEEVAATAGAGGAGAMVITGAGTAFCAGADLGGVHGKEFRHALYAALHAVADVDLPVVAAVNGPAIGAGLQLAIACDLRVASERATFSLPTARHGIAVDPWTIRRLASVAGAASARAMLLGGDEIDAVTARQRGLVDRPGDLEAALEWAQEIADMAPMALSYSKRALAELLEPPLHQPGLDDAFEDCWASDDAAEAVAARSENRPARFRGR